ncbi:sigma-70 family RNA polymerase sigma factor [Pseudonocardia eucalypti]|uniref:Sigma-70 family RNA polymerase sigma factor n=1 Tax=Pseudonocardia eucalypti TaxID=648755 RepID=A0ABP9QLE1_9PSEU|nr:RNA polymerase sigma-70 factor (ECF subfamily) [Pseudonocardia eucalypti]
MSEDDPLTGRFEAHRGELRAVAYRMLGSPGEAEDAVQETWLRLHRADTGDVVNLAGWLRTVLSRVCLDMLRARAARREQVVDQLPDRARDDGDGPEGEAVLVDSVGRALLVVLDRLEPAERVAFVLHDMFAVPFAQIAPIVGRTPVTTKKLASRARHRVRGGPAGPGADLARHRSVVEAFLTAARGGDLEALLGLLAPDVVRRADPLALPPGVATESRGARVVAEEVTVLGRRSRFAEPALVDGALGVLVAPRGRLLLALTFEVVDDRITRYEVIADPDRLRRLDLSVLDDPVVGHSVASR